MCGARSPSPPSSPTPKRPRQLLDELGIDGSGPPTRPARVPGHQMECADLLPDDTAVDEQHPDSLA